MSADAHSNQLRYACDSHSRLLIATVLDRVVERNDICIVNKTATLAKLKQLWTSNLDSANDGTNQTNNEVITEDPGEVNLILVAPVRKHARLREEVPRIPSVLGCRGLPAPFMKRPKYACDSKPVALSRNPMQRSRALGALSAESAAPNVVQDLSCDTAAVPGPTESSSSDLLIGMKLLVDLSVLLKEEVLTAAHCSKWLPGRVVALEAAASRSGTRTASAAAAQPARSRVKARIRFHNGAEVEVGWPGSNCVRIASEQEWRAVAESGYMRVTATSSSSARPIREPSTASAALSEEQSADRALRILLGELDGCEEELLGAADSDSEEEDGEGYQEQGPATRTAGIAALSALGLESGHRAGEYRSERLLLATGERVLSSQLREIEEKFSEYRPRFIITPTQGEAVGGGNGQARRAGFVSRQWAALGSGPGSAAARRLRGEGASGSAAAEDEEPLDVLLAEREDPAVPLPEPQVVIIGRATKKLRRREDCWSTALVDVYVRDLRPPEQRRKSGGDMAVPRCALRLRYAPGSDPQLAENARLLQELLDGQG